MNYKTYEQLERRIEILAYANHALQRECERLGRLLYPCGLPSDDPVKASRFAIRTKQEVI
jgi:hypothetical protein